MKGKQEEANTPKGIMFKYIDKNQLNVENDDELIALINIFASISLGLFFKIFIMGKNMEIDKEKNILRQTHLSGHGRRENDAEHAWHMAIMAYLLREYANEEVNITKVMLMCLIHDIVEIEAGDTYAYDEEGLKSQKEREERAKENLNKMGADFVDGVELILYYIIKPFQK